MEEVKPKKSKNVYCSHPDGEKCCASISKHETKSGFTLCIALSDTDFGINLCPFFKERKKPYAKKETH